MAFIIFFFFFKKKFEIVKKLELSPQNFRLRCTPSVILGLKVDKNELKHQ